MTPPLHLYGHPDSGHAVKIALALALAGLEHETTLVDIWAPRETRPADFLALSPLGQVPVLRMGGIALSQSGAILLTIAERFGVLGGETEEGRIRARTLLMWEHNRIGMCIPQLIEARAAAAKRDGYGDDPKLSAARAWLEARYHADAAAFATHLAGADFFHGTTPGLADCALWGYVQWIEKAGLETTPDIEAWCARMRALPAMRSPETFFPRPKLARD